MTRSAACGQRLASLAAQEYGPLEVIVVDDESSDATAAEAHRSGARAGGQPGAVEGKAVITTPAYDDAA